MGRQRKGGEEESEVADDFPAVDPLELRPSEREMLFDKHAQFCQNVRSNAEARPLSPLRPLFLCAFFFFFLFLLFFSCCCPFVGD